jgi:hypothetical protein
MKKEDYTPEETAKFKAERNAKRDAERTASKNHVMVHLSKHAADYYLKFGLKPTGVTFRGSIRNQFTGPARNNQVFTN